MATLVYLVHGDAPRAQQQLSYSILSALRHGLEGIEILLICDAPNQRPDLPVRHHILSAETTAAWADQNNTPLKRLRAAQLGLEVTGGNICLMATDTAFKAPPRQLFDLITAGGILVQDHDGWLAGRSDWDQVIDACRGTQLEPQVHAGAAMFDIGVLGLTPQDVNLLFHVEELAKSAEIKDQPSEIEQFAFSAAIELEARDVVYARDHVIHYDGYMRHVYHGRFDAMFPPGAPVNTALAHRLPAITEPPKPLPLKLRAKVFALRHRMGRATEFGYLAYLCAFAAPTAEGRDVWANIALDMMMRSSRSAAQIAQHLPRLAPGAIDDAGLRPATLARWRHFWAARGT
ncbi:hypothetical protein [Phaeobacter sp. B1627]|uniref:hypothetical protein n=1 Tax=Phaeobacter sp. B1627 TaxID=2583809 RepID=UPI00111A8771|nr:hypothetical protein [Phaeobacter sp. B1627]TNJ44803.1 hypothetical protein FGE21_07170 [Phaeobacter sp. B1627]